MAKLINALARWKPSFPKFRRKICAIYCLIALLIPMWVTMIGAIIALVLFGQCSIGSASSRKFKKTGSDVGVMRLVSTSTPRSKKEGLGLVSPGPLPLD